MNENMNLDNMLEVFKEVCTMLNDKNEIHSFTNELVQFIESHCNLAKETYELSRAS